jgi:hypothetical protein
VTRNGSRRSGTTSEATGETDGETSGEAAGDAYDRLIALLDGKGARYRLIDHAAEGRTEIVGGLRGNALAQAANAARLDRSMALDVAD